jgi:hypothetical protein
MEKKILIIVLVLLTVALVQSAFAWEEFVTHKYLSEISADNSVLAASKGDYLKTLGFNSGLTEKVVWNNKTRSIQLWLQEGATLEDAGTDWEMFTNVGRSNNHFHNPLKDWPSAGLYDSYSITSPFNTITHYVVGQSALWWAQDPAKQGAFRGNPSEWDWSWQTVRDYFYKGLTSKTETERQEYFARTFRGVGHQMHLIQDMAVPAHVRNDSHVRDSLMDKKINLQHFETWAKKEDDKIKAFAAQYTPSKHKPLVDMSIANGDFIPTTQFFDANKYTGYTPPVVADMTWGLSEYTNANFVSDDTIFTNTIGSSDLKYFPYPRYDPSCYRVVTEVIGANPEGGSIVEEYINRTCDGVKIDKFLAFNPSHNLFSGSTGDRSSFFIDHAVYEAHAKELVPMAVGYSVALVDYFFRGELEISAPNSHVYSIIDGSSSQQFTQVRAKVLNITEDEEIGEGKILAVAQYKINPNYVPDLSTDPPTQELMKDIVFSYSVSEPISISSLSSTEAAEYIFDFTNSPIPAGVTDLELSIVFKGTIGAEKDIAVAVGRIDLTEPTHLTIWNLTDMYALDYHLYTWEDIMKSSGLSLLVDYNPKNGQCCESGEPYIKPFDIKYEIGFTADTSKTAPAVAMETLPPGRFMRLITLMDYEEDFNYIEMKYSNHTGEQAGHIYRAFEGATYQDYNGEWISTPAGSFRSVRRHYHRGILGCKPPVTDANGSYCPYYEDQAIPANLTPFPAGIVVP